MWRLWVVQEICVELQEELEILKKFSYQIYKDIHLDALDLNFLIWNPCLTLTQILWGPRFVLCSTHSARWCGYYWKPRWSRFCVARVQFVAGSITSYMHKICRTYVSRHHDFRQLSNLSSYWQLLCICMPLFLRLHMLLYLFFRFSQQSPHSSMLWLSMSNLVFRR